MGTTLTAYYGNIAILKAKCPNCLSTAFVIDGKMACCGFPFQSNSEGTKRISDVPIGKRGPSKYEKNKIMSVQEGRCFYCDRRFGRTVWRGPRSCKLRVNWDHVSPYAYSLDNRNQNFVAACHVCNILKSSKCFDSIEQARSYLYEAWQRKGYTEQPTVLELRREFQTEKVVAKILQPKMQKRSVV